MNKAELIEKIALRTNSTKCKTEVILNTLINIMSETLLQGEEIQLVGFGTFEVRSRAKKNGHNPQTNEKIRIPARKAPVFKPAKILKNAVKKQH